MSAPNPCPLKPQKSRTRMISFRVTNDEFEQFRTVCLQNGLTNVSEVVRLAVNQLLAAGPVPAAQPSSSLTDRLANLESRLNTIEQNLNL